MVARVLRLRRTDDTEQTFVLVNVEQNGSSKLDLRLVGTDGSSPFVGTVKNSATHRLRSKAYTGTAEEWTLVLKAILLQDDQALQSDAGHGLEAIATIDAQLQIVIRKNIGGITQRLGSIALQQDDDVEINLLDWTADAVSAFDAQRTRLHDLRSLVEDQRATVAKLNTQIDELVKAKKEHEDQLIGKFSELLNAKKLKIRDQQRLLSGAKVEPETAAEVQCARQKGDGRTAGASGNRKRKPQESSSDDEDGFEVAAKEAEDDEDLQEAETPEASGEDDQTEGEDEDEPEGVSHGKAVHSQPSQHGAGRRGKALAKASDPPESFSDSAPPRLPPRRELPFARKPTGRTSSPTRSEDTGGAKSVAAPIGDDEETDDEL